MWKDLTILKCRIKRISLTLSGIESSMIWRQIPRQKKSIKYLMENVKSILISSRSKTRVISYSNETREKFSVDKSCAHICLGADKSVTLKLNHFRYFKLLLNNQQNMIIMTTQRSPSHAKGDIFGSLNHFFTLEETWAITNKARWSGKLRNLYRISDFFDLEQQRKFTWIWILYLC